MRNSDELVKNLQQALLNLDIEMGTEVIKERLDDIEQLDLNFFKKFHKEDIHNFLPQSEKFLDCFTQSQLPRPNKGNKRKQKAAARFIKELKDDITTRRNSYRIKEKLQKFDDGSEDWHTYRSSPTGQTPSPLSELLKAEAEKVERENNSSDPDETEVEGSSRPPTVPPINTSRIKKFIGRITPRSARTSPPESVTPKVETEKKALTDSHLLSWEQRYAKFKFKEKDKKSSFLKRRRSKSARKPREEELSNSTCDY